MNIYMTGRLITVKRFFQMGAGLRRTADSKAYFWPTTSNPCAYATLVRFTP